MLNRRQMAAVGTLAVAAPLLSATASIAAEGEEIAVAQAVEALRLAMIAGDKAKLESLTHPKLSYGHSSGRLENQAEYVAALTSGKSKIKTLTLSEHKNSVVGNDAIARHIFDLEAESEGKISTAHIGVMQVWVKDGSWKLLARQAFKLA